MKFNRSARRSRAKDYFFIKVSKCIITYLMIEIMLNAQWHLPINSQPGNIESSQTIMSLLTNLPYMYHEIKSPEHLKKKTRRSRCQNIISII